MAKDLVGQKYGEIIIKVPEEALSEWKQVISYYAQDLPVLEWKVYRTHLELQEQGRQAPAKAETATIRVFPDGSWESTEEPRAEDASDDFMLVNVPLHIIADEDLMQDLAEIEARGGLM